MGVLSVDPLGCSHIQGDATTKRQLVLCLVVCCGRRVVSVRSPVLTFVGFPIAPLLDMVTAVALSIFGETSHHLWLIALSVTTDLKSTPRLHSCLVSSAPVLSCFVFFRLLSVPVFFLCHSLSPSLSLSISVWCCGRVDVLCCVLCCGVCVVWHRENPVYRLKTCPCVRLKRPRVYRHHAHMCFNMRARCQNTRARFEWTHGGEVGCGHRQFCFPRLVHIASSRASEVHRK